MKKIVIKSIFFNLMILRRKIEFYILLIVFFIFLSCSRNSLSNGGGTDIGNPAKICVVDSLDQPVKDASVKVINIDEWFVNVKKGKIVIDSGFTNSKGEVYFDSSILCKKIYIQVDHSKGGAFIRNFILNNYYIKIKKYGKIIGKINNSKERVTKVIMYGSTYSAVTDTNGSYIFSYIPEGIYSPIACNINFDLFLLPSVKIVGGDTVAITNSNISFNTFTIEDFEDSISTAKIGRFLLNSRIYKAIANNKGTTVEYNIIQEGIKSSKCLKGQLIRNGAWALIGFFLGEKQEGDSLWDFTNATECSFYAKGKGKINVSFESDTIDKLGYFKHYSADVLLDSEWKLINISLDSLKLKDDGNADPPISWKESAKTIKRIEFNAIEGDTIEVWLDEIMIKGMKFF